jgi:hypothetical protein
MSYDIIFGEGALDRVYELVPAEVLNDLEAAFRRLAANPVAHGRPAAFPYSPRGQMYPFHCDVEGKRWHFVAFFYFTEDETALRIFDVTVSDQA